MIHAHQQQLFKPPTFPIVQMSRPIELGQANDRTVLHKPMKAVETSGRRRLTGRPQGRTQTSTLARLFHDGLPDIGDGTSGT
jgi:hypothetical protein